MLLKLTRPVSAIIIMCNIIIIVVVIMTLSVSCIVVVKNLIYDNNFYLLLSWDITWSQ